MTVDRPPGTTRHGVKGRQFDVNYHHGGSAPTTLLVYPITPISSVLRRPCVVRKSCVSTAATTRTDPVRFLPPLSSTTDPVRPNSESQRVSVLILVSGPSGPSRPPRCLVHRRGPFDSPSDLRTRPDRSTSSTGTPGRPPPSGPTTPRLSTSWVLGAETVWETFGPESWRPLRIRP